jgi:predicted MPP superfamily phosphohydrolase
MKFLHISDLHYDPVHDGRTSKDLREELLEYLNEQNIFVDELLITGDYRYAATQKREQAEIDEVVKYINKIAETVGIKDHSHIQIVPGNHDRDRKKGDLERLDKIRDKYDPASGEFKKIDLELLLRRFQYFQMVCKTLYGTNDYWPEYALHTYHVSSDTVFLNLNTAVMHGSDKDRIEKRLVVGNNLIDHLLDEIEEKYPDYPVIILAHHSPDMFEKHEKEAVEEILLKHPSVKLYLCGDSHEPWPRMVNHHLEVTMGNLKQEKGAEETFMYGDTDTQEFNVYHWVKAWEPYTAYSKKIKKQLDAKLPVASKDKKDIEKVDIRIRLNDKGELLNEIELANDLAGWIANDKAENISVNVAVAELEQLSKKYEEMLEKVKTKTLSSKEESEEFSKLKEQEDFTQHMMKRAGTACELFLKDRYLQEYSGIIEIDDYVRELLGISQVGAGCYKKTFGSTPLEFFISRDNGKEIGFVVSADIKDKERYYEIYCRGMNGDFYFCDLFGLDEPTLSAIYSQFYARLADEVIMDPSILKEKKLLQICSYNVAIS